MFKKATQDIVNELDPSGELIPLTSAYDSRTLDLLSMVKVVKSSWMYLFSAPRYIPTSVKLADLLLCRDTVDCGDPCQQDLCGLTVMDKESGEVNVKSAVGSGQANIDMATTVSPVDTKLQRISVNYSKLHKIIRTSQVNIDHALIQEVRTNEKITKLGVVYDVLKTKNPLCLQQTFKGMGSAVFSIRDIVTMDSVIKKEKEKKLLLEAGSVLGFKVQFLPLNLEKDTKLKPTTWDTDGVADMVEACHREWDSGDVSVLKNMVETAFIVFTEMGQDVRQLIWNLLSGILACSQALHVLDCILEEGFLCAAGPSLLDSVPLQFRPKVQELLSVVGLDPGKSCSSPFVGALGLLVSSMLEVDEEALSLIVSLNRESQEQMLILVEGLLEGVCKNTVQEQTWRDLFLSSPVHMVREVLQACGVLLDENQPYPALGTAGKPSLTLISIFVVLKGLPLLKVF